MNKKSCINLNFCKIYYNKEDPFIKDFIDIIKKAYLNNKVFFGKKISKFNITLIYSRKEMNFLRKWKTPDYIISFAGKKGIIIFSPYAIEKETCWKKNDFYSTLVHEINHIFYIEITKSYKPIWLSEGLATYLQNNKTKPEIKGKVKLSYSVLNKKFKKEIPVDYEIYHLFVYYLIKRYGKTKIKMLLNSIKKGKKIEKMFLTIYNKSLKDLIKDANKI